jgi:hypothetical protein
MVSSTVEPTSVLATRIAARSITISPGGGGQAPCCRLSFAIVFAVKSVRENSLTGM